ncbi:MAG: hypothetical protein ACRDTE_16005 [Pseudonocardiaceae bacterium]
MSNPTGGNRVPRWLRVTLASACAPVLIGVLVLLYREGLSAPVLVGGIVGPLVGVAWHRRRTRHLTP